MRIQLFSLCTLAIIGGISAVPGVALGEELLVSSYSNGNILRYDLATGTYLGKLVSGGTANLTHPEGLAIGSDGNLYVSSSENSNPNIPNAVLRFNLSTGVPIGNGVFATGFGVGGITQQGIPRGITFGPDGNLYVANDGAEVRRYDGVTGQFMNTFASGLTRAEDPVFHNGFLYVTDRDASRVNKYDAVTGQFISTIINGGPLSKAEGMTFGPDGNIYISSANTDQILQYTSTGQFIKVFVSTQSGGLDNPENLRFGPDGNLYVAASASNKVFRFDGLTGAFMSTFQITADLNTPTYLLVVPEPATLMALFVGLFVIRRR